MMTGLLDNDRIRLRPLERSDLDVLYAIENDSNFWEVSSTLTPFSRELLTNYLNNARQDLFEAKQLRLAITKKNDDNILGLIDLFDFDPHHNRAGIGILVLKEQQGKGYAADALDIFLQYAFQYLDLHQLFASIPVQNEKSQKLFKKFNFTDTGVKKDWIKVNGKFQDVSFLQLINPNHE